MKRTLSFLLAALLCLTLVSGITLKTSDADSTKYRALLVGETDFGFEYAERNLADVVHMSEMLHSVTGPSGEEFEVHDVMNASARVLQSSIQTAFRNTTENDVSLFFIATHGDSDGDGDLCLTDGSYYSWVDFETLAGWLYTYVKGKVVVILESCGAGSAIYANGAEAHSTFDEAAFTEKAIDAFRAYEKRTGELRDSKFYVLAAAAHHQESWGSEGYNPGNYFTKWLVEGVGTSGSMPADTNNDCIVTLNELYQYIAQYDDYTFYLDGYYYTQQVQVYPENSSFRLFRRGGMTYEWHNADGKWKCFDENGKMMTGWQKLNGVWFYFEADGALKTGWFLDAGKWYYLEPEGEAGFEPGTTGAIFTDGWRKVDGRWYFFNPGGHIACNTWKEIPDGSGTWYYFSGGGQMVTGWQKLNGSWYLFNPGGTLVTGWRKINGNWYYLGNGAMRTGWQKISGTWYYFKTASEDPEGAMVTGDYTIKGETYHFDDSGAWLG